MGKTIQIVSFLRGLFHSAEARHVLIVMPLALLENWKREFETWLVNDPSNRTNTQTNNKLTDWYCDVGTLICV